jgi:hypothetical protein
VELRQTISYILESSFFWVQRLGDTYGKCVLPIPFTLMGELYRNAKLQDAQWICGLFQQNQEEDDHAHE